MRSLFPLATIVTPNLPEASALLGGRPINDVAAMEAAARDLHALGPQYVLVKGGHLDAGEMLLWEPLLKGCRYPWWKQEEWQCCCAGSLCPLPCSHQNYMCYADHLAGLTVGQV